MNSPLVGKVLVAAQALVDPNFAQAVVLIVEDDQGGAMGMIINRPLETEVRTIWSQVSEMPYRGDDVLFGGGPCEGPLMVLHQQTDAGQVEVQHGLYLTTDADKVRRLVAEQTEGLKFFVGYAGWSAAQLESELAEGAWLVSDVSSEQVLSNGDELWATLTQHWGRSRIAGVDPRLIPPDPSVN